MRAEQAEAAIGNIDSAIDVKRKIIEKICSNPKNMMFEAARGSYFRCYSCIQEVLCLPGKGVADGTNPLLRETSQDKAPIQTGCQRNADLFVFLKITRENAFERLLEMRLKLGR